MGTSDPSTDPPGALPEFADFDVLEELGRSPQGTIYKARRKIERDTVALKVLRPSVCDKQYLQQLSANAEASFFLAHKGLVRALGCILTGDAPILVSEFASGQSLARMLNAVQVRSHPPKGQANRSALSPTWERADVSGANAGRGGRYEKFPGSDSENTFSTTRALELALECADALRHAAAHGRHHGRLHPADVMVGEARTRIIGVGLGERPKRSPSDGEPYAFDPLLYTAPEAMPGQTPPTTSQARTAADVYSLGAILLHVLTGKPPPTDSARSEATENLPPAIRPILGRMLSPDPAARPGYDSIIATLGEALKAIEPAKPQVQDSLVPEPLELTTAGRHAPDVPPATTHGEPAPQQASLKAEEVPAPEPTPIPRRAVMVAIAASVLLVILGFFVPRSSLPGKTTGDRPQENGPDTPPESLPDTSTAPATQSPSGTGEMAPSEQTVPEQPPISTPAPEENTAPKPPLRPDDEYGLATRQLDALQDLLRRGDLKYTPALLKAVRTIQEKAGPNTPTGVRARKFATEVEQRLGKQGKT